MNMRLYKNIMKEAKAPSELKERTLKAAEGLTGGEKRAAVKRLGKISPYVSAAAALLAAASFCAAAGAVSGKMDLFFGALSDSSYSDNAGGERLPAGGEPVSAARLYSCPEAEISCADGISCELLGAYSDRSAAVVSLKLTVPDGLSAQRNIAAGYFSLELPDGSAHMTVQNGIADSCETVPSEDGENAYTLTWCITDPDISGSILNMDIAGLFTADEAALASAAARAEQDKLRGEYVSEGDIAGYKEYWNENGLDAKTLGAERAALSRTEGAAYAVTVRLRLPDRETEAVRRENNGVSVCLDELSLWVSDIPEDIRKDGSAVPAVILKDGSVISSEEFVLDGLGADEEKYRPFAYRRGMGKGAGMIYCFDTVTKREDIDRIVLCVRYYDAGWNEHIDSIDIM
ncbi:MAG: hypothetical protein NC120_01210 [Ruminococcus sp.]|nr:hypothetical protein [Ruminococcus sp.]